MQKAGTCSQKNIGEHMSIDETAFSCGEVFTILSHKQAHCMKGAIAAYVKGIRVEDIVEAIMS